MRDMEIQVFRTNDEGAAQYSYLHVERWILYSKEGGITDLLVGISRIICKCIIVVGRSLFDMEVILRCWTMPLRTSLGAILKYEDPVATPHSKNS